MKLAVNIKIFGLPNILQGPVSSMSKQNFHATNVAKSGCPLKWILRHSQPSDMHSLNFSKITNPLVDLTKIIQERTINPKCWRRQNWSTSYWRVDQQRWMDKNKRPPTLNHSFDNRQSCILHIKFYPLSPITTSLFGGSERTIARTHRLYLKSSKVIWYDESDEWSGKWESRECNTYIL